MEEVKNPRWEEFSSRQGFFVSWAATRGIGGEATNKRMHKRVPMCPACGERKNRGSGYSILYTRNRSIIPRYRKAVVPSTHTAENHDFISSDHGSRSSTSKSLFRSARSGNMLSK